MVVGLTRVSLVVVVGRVVCHGGKLVLSELPQLALELHVEGDDRENEEDDEKARRGAPKTYNRVELKNG